MRSTTNCVVSMVVLVSLTSGTLADSFEFSYLFEDSSLLAGSFDGVLGRDNDTITDIEKLTASLDGTDLEIAAWSKIGGGGETLSLSGIEANIYARNRSGLDKFQLFNRAGNALGMAGYGLNQPVAFTQVEFFNSRSWDAVMVPEPMAASLFCIGLVALAWVRRSRV